MRARFTTNLLLAVASVVFAAAAVELGVRLFGPTVGSFLLPTRTNCLQRSALLSLEFRPDCNGTLSGTHFQTNGLGLRGPALRADAPTRILAVGDSCTWGWGVGQEESFPARLQQILHEQIPSRKHEVINAGVPGYTSYQGLGYLRERGLALQPAIVIVGFGFNDQLDTGDIARQIETENRYAFMLRLDDFLLDRSVTYRWARWRAAEAARRSRGPRVPLDQYGTNLREIVQLARASEAKVFLLSFFHYLGKRQDYRKVLYDLSSDLRVPILEYDGKKLDLLHPTSEGYQRFATAIFERMQAEGYVP